MTNEEMAAALKSAGWRVEPPLTQDTCDHPVLMQVGSGMISCDGSSKSESLCRKCGKTWKYETLPRPQSESPYGHLWNRA